MSLGGSPEEAGVGCGSHQSVLSGGRPQRLLISMSSPGGHHFGIKTWPYLTAYRLQCRKASGQTTSKMGTQPHPSADRLPKAILSSQPPINTPLDTALPTRGTRPTSEQAPVPPTRKPAQASGPTSPTRGQTPEARRATILQPAERRPQTQKIRQNETAEKCVSDEGTR